MEHRGWDSQLLRSSPSRQAGDAFDLVIADAMWSAAEALSLRPRPGETGSNALADPRSFGGS
jgi:hypothetical protein